MFTMSTQGHHHVIIQHQLCLLFIASSTFAVVLYQTIPENNSLVCSGEVLQYTCISNDTVLGWEFELGEDSASAFTSADDINSTKMFGQFELKLTAKNGTVYTSTATNNNITSNYDNTQVDCIGGSSNSETIIAVADGPANCSDIDVLCKTASNAANNSRTDILIYLTTNSSLMCVVEYEIKFEQIIMSIPATSPSANFTISKTELQGQPFVTGTIYTLDAENRMGQVPCLFSIAEPTAVENITFVSECDKSSLTVSVRVSWMPSEIEGCLDYDTRLEYIIEFHSSSINNVRRTFDISYMLPGVPEGIDLGVTITPTLPDLGLSGSPLSTTIHIVKTSCVASSFSTTSSTTLSTVAPTDASNLGVILGVTAVLISILGLVVLIVLVALCCCCKKGKCGRFLQQLVSNRGYIRLQTMIVEMRDRNVKMDEKFAEGDEKLQAVTLEMRDQNVKMDEKLQAVTKEMRNQNAKMDEKLQAVTMEMRDQKGKMDEKLDEKLQAVTMEMRDQNAKMDEKLQAVTMEMRDQNVKMDEKLQAVTKTQQKMEERLTKLEDQSKSEQDNQNKEYLNPVVETHMEQRQRDGAVKNPSEHLSDSGLAKTATERDVTTQDDYEQEAEQESQQNAEQEAQQESQENADKPSKVVSVKAPTTTGKTKRFV